MNVLFLEREDGTQFAALNLNQFCYLEGTDETDEHPQGSQSRVHFHGYILTVGVPYKVLADKIAQHIKEEYEYSIKMAEFNRQRSADSMRSVLKEIHGGS